MEIVDSTNTNKKINKQITLLKREKKTGIIFNWDISTLYPNPNPSATKIITGQYNVTKLI